MVCRSSGTLPLVAMAAVAVALPAAANSTSSTAPETKLPYGWSWPAWSTNGTLAFTGGPVGRASGPGSSTGVFVASRTGKHLRRVAVIKLGGFPQPLQNLSWAPRGTQIVCLTASASTSIT
jgi:hypothetical protein